jgi:uncharacterized protein (DUF1501 family)
MNRRRFLRRSLQAVPTLMTLGSGAALWTAAGPAQAQSTSYRALVCVFLYGGNDGLNMIPPLESAAYARYAAARGAVAIAQNQIIPLDATHGLHPNLSALQPAWAERKMALLFNVGPLARPLTLTDYLAWRELNDPARVPDALFSHSDQQQHWESASTSKAVRTGWGARLIEAASGASPVISLAGSPRFGIGNVAQSLTLPGPGSPFGLNGYWSGAQPDARRLALDALIASGSQNVLQTAYSAVQRNAMQAAGNLSAILAQAPANGSADASNPELSAAFGHLSGAMNNPLARQLYQVAKLIKNRASVGGNRHLFFVSLGGFDHHENQLSRHAALMTTLGGALAAFYAATRAIGLQDSVTTFTESDFGRTLKANGSAGTDHAWGNQQLVIGGSVNGGASYGTYPSLQLGGPDDAGRNGWEHQGRWIPGVSVDQYAATLGKWFAPELGASGLDAVLPNLANFATRDLGFLAAG